MTKISLSLLLLLLLLCSPATASEAPPEPAPEIPATGEEVPPLKPFDDLMARFLREHEAVGASICVSRGGEIIYNRGFGYADAENGLPVQPESKFRIASISKPITAVAILKLYDERKLSLEDNPFVFLGYSDELETDGADERLKEITIKQLLHHTGGFDRGASFDPMFRYHEIAEAMNSPLPPRHDDIIRYMLRRELDFDPGAKYAYSNFGYCVLGRVIEKAGGKEYERYVREEILEPLGINGMRIGRSLPQGRAKSEVVYHTRKSNDRRSIITGKPVDRPYAIDHEVMDSHGAWIASAEELVRFAMAFDDPEKCPLLKPETVRLMFSPPEAPAFRNDDGELNDYFYALGWMVRPKDNGENAWHNGYIPGTSTLLVRRWDDMNWAVLFNSDDSQKKPGALSKLIDPMIHEAAAKVEEWPE